MKSIILTAMLLAATLLSGFAHGQGRTNRADNQIDNPLNATVVRFVLTDATLIEGLSKLSERQVPGLHLGIEEVLSDPSQGPVPIIRFSLTLENATVCQLLDELCQHDSRYAWSMDGLSINIYAKQNIENAPFFLNRELSQITLKQITDPAQTLTPLATMLQNEQLGYAGAGGDPSYSEPWTVSFEHLTVRQLTNRVSEHIGSRSTSILSGAQQSRFFFFAKGSFR